MDNEPKNIFRDANGCAWNPVLTTPVIMQACRQCGLSIAKLASLDINVADLLELLWLACQAQAKGRDVSRERFFELVTPAVLPEALKALWAAVGEAFPAVREVAAGDAFFAKLARGASTTSPSSSPSPGPQ